ncbi:hypothetical protein M3Y99_01151900 [Aphelenchoides fujianensis]|nr:hypothetical protein M3Y99_01151900 [Aphelenchoides fujianensis]
MGQGYCWDFKNVRFLRPQRRRREAGRPTRRPKEAAAAAEAPVVGPAYEPFVLSIDPAVSACTDFYAHACGRWQRTHPLREGVHERTVLSEAQRSIDKQLEALIDTNTPATAEETQMKRFFDLCLDEPALRQTASTPILDRVVAAGGFHVTAGNLGMPPADFADAQKLALYRNYLTDLSMIVAGDARSPRSADQIRGDLERAVDFERQFAAVVERHNAAVWEDAAFTTLPNEFVELLRSVSTDATFQPFLTTHTSIRVKDLATIRDLDTLVQATPPEMVADYVLLHYLDRIAPFLDRRFVDVIENYKDRRANRRSEFERRRYCTDLTRRLFHELTDQLFIRSFLAGRHPHGGPAGYAAMNFAQFAEALQRLRETQEFRGLERGDAPNFFAGSKQSESQVMNDIDLNLLFVTAAFAQSPFFHSEHPHRGAKLRQLGNHPQPLAWATPVDTKGRFRDSRGGQRDWWAGATDRQYAASSQCLVDRFSATPVPELGGANIDGQRTLQENAGEYLGIKTAFDAYKKNAGTATAPLPGFSYTQDQIFFLSYAMANCANRDAEDLRRLMGGGWSPEHQRVNLLLANTPAFARAFNCPGRRRHEREPQMPVVLSVASVWIRNGFIN